VKLSPSSIILLLMVMTAASVGLRAQQPGNRGLPSADQVAHDPRTQRALAWLGRNADWITAQHIRINEIPAPPFGELSRAAAVRRLLEGNGLKLRTDELHNVIGERTGTDARNVIIFSAHLDTVFPPGTDTRVRREPPADSGRPPERLVAPGISDNSVGLAALVGVARALHDARIRTHYTIVFAADVGEEGEGNLRGMRKLMETYKGRVRAVIALDGPGTDHITAKALASRRIEVTVSGPGGHSWSDFGLPNPIHALSRGVARFVRIRVPEEPRTTFNVGTIEGGTSVNSIPYSASIKVDMRSGADAEIERLEAALRDAIRAGVEEENAAARERGALKNSNHARLEAKFRVLGVRPGGELPNDAPLLEAARGVDRLLNNRSRIERSSTDANIPLSMGIPAISIGAGGRGGSAHSLGEWYEPAGRELGLKRALLILLTTAGLGK
jgi:acetylornithine deacetylase/succinyl-diaminopimelate desuccinylase-like protein